jgi:hypothetical protein
MPSHLTRALLVAAMLGVATADPLRAQPAATDLSRQFLDQLEERQMPDVVLWALDRLERDPGTAADLRREIPFRRAAAIVATSRAEADPAKRAATLDAAEQQIDAFLAVEPEGLQAIDAYTQKANLLIERGRAAVEQAGRPGADTQALRARAAGYFDRAIQAVEGTAQPGQEIMAVTNAEDAAVKAWRETRARIATLTGDEKDRDDKDRDGRKENERDQASRSRAGRRPARLSAAQTKELEGLRGLDEQLQTKIIQARLMKGAAWFEKATALEPGSKAWKAAIDASTSRFKEVADKYPTMGGGLFARYYLGRNLTLLGEHARAITELAPLTALEGRSPLAVSLRVKAAGTMYESALALQAFDGIDEAARAFALTPVEQLPGRRLDDDWTTLKYRAAALLAARAESLDARQRGEREKLNREALKLARDVALADGGFAAEARELSARLGRELPDATGGQDFAGTVAEGRLAVAGMQEKIAAEAAAAADDKAAAREAVARDREAALAVFEKAVAIADRDQVADEATVNYARFMVAFLAYQAGRHDRAAEMATLLVERHPNATGSRQAATIGLASLQQLARARGDVGEPARARLLALAEHVAGQWPGESEGAEAIAILAGAAIESGDPDAIIAAVGRVPADSPRRPQLLQRAGSALAAIVGQQARLEPLARAAPERVAAWKTTALDLLDTGLDAPVPSGAALRIMVTAAVARTQLALDAGDVPLAIDLLRRPGYGPWTAVTAAAPDAAVRDPALVEAVLTVALRTFIQGDALDDAQRAMDRLEALAGAGDGSSERLTAMYIQMGRQLQDQLRALGQEGSAAGPKVNALLGGFEKFLDGLAARSPRFEHQMWVASTYVNLGSSDSGEVVVPPARAAAYLDRAAAIFDGLLARKTDATDGARIAELEPALRLRLADLDQQRGRWDAALGHLDWVLSDPARQNSLTIQMKAAELLQAAGRTLAATSPRAADERLREAVAGRRQGSSVMWGWGGLSNRLAGPAFSGDDERARKARDQFFECRYHVAWCLFERSKLATDAATADDLRAKAETAIALTWKLNRDLGGEASRGRFETLLKSVQRGRRQPGTPNSQAEPLGFAAFDDPPAAGETDP